jgi:hypothetical protein
MPDGFPEWTSLFPFHRPAFSFSAPCQPAMATLNQIFDAVRQNLAGRMDHVSHILSGPRCEQWLNPESRAAINSAIRGQQEHVNAEVYYAHQRADFVVNSITAKGRPSIEQIGEGKVIWNEDSGKITSALKDLRRQLHGHKREHPRAHCVGILYAVWHGNKMDDAEWGAGEAEDEFLHRVQDLVKRTFLRPWFDFPLGDTPQLAIGKVSTGIGVFRTTNSLALLLIRRRNETARERAARSAAANATLKAQREKKVRMKEIRKLKPTPRRIRRITTTV